MTPLESPTEQTSRAVSRWLKADTVHVVAAALFALILIDASPITPNDLWWHLRMGQILLSNGLRLPSVDPFSFTRAGAPWIDQAWLVELGYAALDRAGGLPLLLFAHALVVACGYGVVLAYAVRRYGARAGALAALAGMAIGAANWGIRPQAFSFLAFGVLVVLVEVHRSGGRWARQALFGVAALMALWANCHGGFVFGIAYFGIYVVSRLLSDWGAGAAGQHRAEIALAGLFALFATTLNPQGFGLWSWVVGFVTSRPMLQINAEYFPMSLRERDGAVYFAATALGAFALVRSRVKLRPDQLVALAVFAALALWVRRNAAWYGLVAIVPLAAVFSHLRQTWVARPSQTDRVANQRENPWVPAFLLIVLLGAAVVTLPWLRERRASLVSDDTPQDAVAFLCNRAAADARIFAAEVFGVYWIEACPRLPVFIDTRFELYLQQQWDDYIAMSAGRFDWDTIAKRYRLTHLMLSRRTQGGGIDAARVSPHWHIVFEDDRAVVFERGTPF